MSSDESGPPSSERICRSCACVYRAPVQKVRTAADIEANPILADPQVEEVWETVRPGNGHSVGTPSALCWSRPWLGGVAIGRFRGHKGQKNAVGQRSDRAFARRRRGQWR
jgi:hypothetical protein